MKTAAGLVALFVGVFVAFLIQETLPAVHVIHGARFVFVPLIFCYAAMMLPFPAMLAGAVYVGLMSDMMYLHVVGGRVEIAMGWSIMYFVIFGSIAQGLHQGAERGHWWPIIPLSALATSGYLLLQFAMISLRREGFEFNEAGAWRILAPGILAALFAPLLHIAVQAVGRLLLMETPGLRNY